MRKIDFKKGSGASLIGLAMIMVVFVVGICMMTNFSFFHAGIETQTKTDAIADGTAAAANNGGVIPDLDIATEVMNELTNRNSLIMTRLGLETEFDRRSLLEDNLLVLNSTGRYEFTSAAYFGLAGNSGFLTTTGKNITLLHMQDLNDLENTFPDDPSMRCNPSITADATPTGPIDPDLYRDVVLQFAVEMNARYQPRLDSEGNQDTRQDTYLWDVTSALGCELPFFYTTSHGEAWDESTDGVRNPDGTTANEMQTVEEFGYHDWGRAYLPYVTNGYDNRDGAYLASCPAPYNDYYNWKLIAQSDNTANFTDEDMAKVQKAANDGYPTVIIYYDTSINGRIEIVVPEIVEMSAEADGLYVSYAANMYVGENSYVYGANTEAALVTYKRPTGKFYVISYAWHE